MTRRPAFMCMVLFTIGLLFTLWLIGSLNVYPKRKITSMTWTDMTTTRNASATSDIVLLNITTPFDSRPSPTHPTVNTSTFLDILRDFVARAPSKSTEDLFIYVTDILRQEWRHDQRNSEYFKLSFRETIRMSTYDNIMLTRKTKEAYKEYKVDDPIFKMFPKESLLPRPPYNSCSIVGSSGILLGSQCGNEIDKADMVFRFNIAPTWGFETDVGSKTNMTTMNPSIPLYLYQALKNSTDIKRFARWMSKQNGLVWCPQTMKIALRAIKISKKANANLTFSFENFDHFEAVEQFWKQFGGIKKYASTGFYFISSALDLCTHVNVFGFWPFNVTADGRDTGFHYYNNVILKTHDMNNEFRTIVGMHQAGLLRLHVGNCTDNMH